MSTPSSNARLSWANSVGLWPGAPTDPHMLPGGIGPRAIPLVFDFTASGSNGAAIVTDFTLEEQNGLIGSIQGIFIDNSANPANNFTITFPNCGQKISIPKNSQAIMPIWEPTPLRVTASSAGLVLVPCLFLNMPVAPVVWTAS